MLEQGVVWSIRGELAEVVIRPASEEACATCGSCAEGTGGRLLTVDRWPGMEPGTRVVVEVREAKGLGPPAVAFLLPVAALVAGAAVGSAVPGWFGRPELSGTVSALLGAAVFLLPALVGVRRYDRSLRRRGYAPRVVRIEG